MIRRVQTADDVTSAEWEGEVTIHVEGVELCCNGVRRRSDCRTHRREPGSLTDSEEASRG